MRNNQRSITIERRNIREYSENEVQPFEANPYGLSHLGIFVSWLEIICTLLRAGEKQIDDLGTIIVYLKR